MAVVERWPLAEVRLYTLLVTFSLPSPSSFKKHSAVRRNSATNLTLAEIRRLPIVNEE